MSSTEQNRRTSFDGRATPIEFVGVGKRYACSAHDALADVSYAVREGEICGVIGRSGAGKSTLLRLVNRLESPSSGRVLVHGADIAILDERALARARQRIGMVFQHFNLFSAKTVWENVALPLIVAGAGRRVIDARVGELLDLVGLGARRDAYPSQLSGGQKQRVGIARALVHEPDILLSDEATSALDPETTHSILDLLRGINRDLGLTILLITHEMSVIRAVCDSAVVMDKGRIVEHGPVREVFGAPRHEVTRALLGPLLFDLPHEIQCSLRESPGGGADRAVLRLRFPGRLGRAVDLAGLLREFGPDVQLLYSDIDSIQSYALGQIVMSVPQAGLPGDLEEKAGRLSAEAEVLGYA